MIKIEDWPSFQAGHAGSIPVTRSRSLTSNNTKLIKIRNDIPAHHLEVVVAHAPDESTVGASPWSTRSTASETVRRDRFRAWPSATA